LWVLPSPTPFNAPGRPQHHFSPAATCWRYCSTDVPMTVAAPANLVRMSLAISYGSSLFGVGCVRATGAMPAELDPLARRRCRPTGGVAPTSSFMVLVFL